MSAESQIDLAYFCNQSFENAENFKFEMSNEQQPQYVAVPIPDESHSVSQQTVEQTKRKKKPTTGRAIKKPKTDDISAHFTPEIGNPESMQSQQFAQDQQLYQLHNEYLKKIQSLTPENNQLTSEIIKMIKELRDKLKFSCCQICKKTPDTNPLRLMGEKCGHKFCCGPCASEYLKQMLSEKDHICIVCRQESKIVCCK